MPGQPSQEDIMEFERNRNQLMAISGQKQQLQMQSVTLGKSIEELDKTTEKKVYKAVGNILILTDVLDTKKELADAKETIDLRLKTLQKQEDATVSKLNALRSKIETALKPQEQGDETVSEPSKKNKKA
ncbi:MAG: prefoldin subunit [Candidatus Micrarchaeota archaeon]